jgi:hypothetical protein
MMTQVTIVKLRAHGGRGDLFQKGILAYHAPVPFLIGFI